MWGRRNGHRVKAFGIALVLLLAAYADGGSFNPRSTAARAVLPAIAWLVALAIAVVISIVAIVIMPKPKQPKPPAMQDADSPTSEAGRPIPVVFGTVTIKGLNVLWFGDKSTNRYEIKA